MGTGRTNTTIPFDVMPIGRSSGRASRGTSPRRGTGVRKAFARAGRRQQSKERNLLVFSAEPVQLGVADDRVEADQPSTAWPAEPAGGSGCRAAQSPGRVVMSARDTSAARFVRDTRTRWRDLRLVNRSKNRVTLLPVLVAELERRVLTGHTHALSHITVTRKRAWRSVMPNFATAATHSWTSMEELLG